MCLQVSPTLTIQTGPKGIRETDEEARRCPFRKKETRPFRFRFYSHTCPRRGSMGTVPRWRTRTVRVPTHLRQVNPHDCTTPFVWVFPLQILCGSPLNDLSLLTVTDGTVGAFTLNRSQGGRVSTYDVPSNNIFGRPKGRIPFFTRTLGRIPTPRTKNTSRTSDGPYSDSDPLGAHSV